MSYELKEGPQRLRDSVELPLSWSLHRGLSGFETLRDEWDTLALRHGTHFVHFPAWYGAELERSGDQGVFFAALRDSRSRLVAVLPLQHGRCISGYLRVPIVQLYYPSEMGVNDVLSRVSLRPHWPSVSALLRRELPFFLFMRWQCVLENGWAVTAAEPGGHVRPTHQSKYLAFADGWSAFLGRYSSNFRSGMGKKLRKLERQSPLRLTVAASPSELASAFPLFLEVEDSGWKGSKGTSILKQPSAVRYYRHLLERFGRIGLCRIGLLYSGTTPIAAQFGVEVGDCLYLLKIGFRQDFGQYSPGSLSMYKLVQHLCEQTAVRNLSFVTGVGWLDRWHPSALQAGVFYTDCDNGLSKAAVRLVRWAGAVRQLRTDPRTSAVHPG